MRPNPFFILLLLVVAVFSGTETNAQSRRSSYYADEDYPRFSVGLAPLSMLFRDGKFNVRGEWAYSDNKSVSLLVSVPNSTSAPDWLSKRIDLDAAGDKTVTDTYKAFGFILDHRFYVGSHEAPKGFYLSPYIRYNRFSVTRTAENETNNTRTTVTGAVGGLGLGGALGYQFKLGEHVTLDATFLGLDLKWLRGSLSYSTNDPENDLAQFRDEVQAKVADIPLIGERLAAELEGDHVKVRTPGVPVPGVRFNLAVNYVF